MIEFLCPNGHRIRCQAEHVGRGAKCPRCGVKFLVPAAPEVEQPSSDSDSGVSGPDFTDSGIGRNGAGPTMAALFARLWRLRRAGMAVELRLHNGETLVPDQFLEQFSQPSHGVFAVKEADGSTSLTAVAWASVDRATLRGLSELPREL